MTTNIVVPSVKQKIVLLGDQSVGKTSIITRFMFDTFDQQYQATIGIDFFSKNLFVDGKTARLHLWDTAGQERFRALIPSYIRNSACAIVVYDLSDRNTFLSSFKWIDNVREVRGDEVTVFLVGNKLDLGDHEKREVSAEEAQKQAKEYGAHFMEVSAKSGLNIQSLFKQVVQVLPGVEAGSAAQGANGGSTSANAKGGFGAARDPFIVTPSAMREADARAGAAAAADGNSGSRCAC